MPGTLQDATMTIGKETTAGTSVVTTRELYPEFGGQLVIDRMRSFHEAANRGTKSNITHATQRGVAVTVPFRTASDVGVSFDELVILGSQLRGAQTGSGGAADKTWSFSPNQTAAGAQESYTIEVADATQAYEVEYCQASRFRLSAGRDDLTQMELDFFGRQSTKVTATTVAGNSAVKIPGALWTIKFATAQSGLTGASVSTNFLAGWDLDVDTGLRPRWYQDGALYFGQSVESGHLGGTLSLTSESTALAITEFYDKAAADTMSFVRLRATGPVLGGTFYQVSIDLAILYDDVQTLGAVDDGVNMYSITARLAYDSSMANTLTVGLVNTLTALP